MGKKEIIPSKSVSNKMKVVLDTSVFISSMLFRGKLGTIVQNWKEGTFDFLLSKEVLSEYIRVLYYPKFKLNEKEIKGIIEEELLPYITPVVTHSNIKVVKNDPSDDKFFALAVDGNADVIVSSDARILSVKKYKGIVTMSAMEFLEK